MIKQRSTKKNNAQKKKSKKSQRVQPVNEEEVSLERLTSVFENAPAFICTIRGKDHVFELANKQYYQLIGHRDIIGKSVRAALPESVKQGFITLLDGVYKKQQPFVGNEIKIALQREKDSPLEDRYVNFVYQPIIEPDGKTSGIFVHGVDVTEQVVMRKRVEQSERALQEQLQVTATMANNASACLFMINHKGMVTFLNPAAQRVTGFTNDDAVGKSMHKLVHHSHPDGRPYPESKCPLLQTYKKGKPNPLHEDIFFRKDGKPFPALISGTPLVGPEGVRATVVEFRDITQEKLAKDTLSESEERFRTMADNIPNLAWMANPDGFIFWYNSRWYEYTGTNPKDMEGWGWQSVHDPLTLQLVLSKWKRSIKTKKEFEMVFPLKAADGSFHPFLTRVVPVRNSAGKVTRWFGTNTDITEQKKVEESLKESEARIRFMADSMPQQVWSATPDGALDYVNQYTINYFKKKAEHIIGAGWQTVIHPEDLPNCISAWMESLSTGNTYQVFFRLRKHDGTYRWHLGRAIPQIEDGKITKWFGTNTDIDDQKKLETQKDDFLGIASHELKTPVTSIKAYGQVLEATFRRSGDLKAAEQLLKMDAQINRLSNLIADLLDVTKIQTGRMQFHQENFDFNTLVTDTIEEMQRTTDKHTIELILGKSKKVFGDKERIGQVLTNFITNAIKYSPHTSKIIVTSAATDKDVVLAVKDFGVGIEEKNKEKVFEQFYRVSGPKQDTFPGLGLGLYISSEIIKREGGKIWVESAVGKGSTFCFSLPLQKKRSMQQINTLVHEEIKHG